MGGAVGGSVLDTAAVRELLRRGVCLIPRGNGRLGLEVVDEALRILCVCVNLHVD